MLSSLCVCVCVRSLRIFFCGCTTANKRIYFHLEKKYLPKNKTVHVRDKRIIEAPILDNVYIERLAGIGKFFFIRTRKYL